MAITRTGAGIFGADRRAIGELARSMVPRAYTAHVIGGRIKMKPLQLAKRAKRRTRPKLALRNSRQGRARGCFKGAPSG